MNNQSIHKKCSRVPPCRLLTLLSLLALPPRLHCLFPSVVLLSYCCWHLPAICSLSISTSHSASTSPPVTYTSLTLPSTLSYCTLPSHAAHYLLTLPSTPSYCTLPSHAAVYLLILPSISSHCSHISHAVLYTLLLPLHWSLPPLPHTLTPPTHPCPLLHYLLFLPTFYIPPAACSSPLSAFSSLPSPNVCCK